ncbi:hypothetical protein [Priestia megaterium]|uniref:hypothetical protein n=1 Tax=Priestia megaterium TaxID=1404 RepID=UPI00317D19DE
MARDKVSKPKEDKYLIDEHLFSPLNIEMTVMTEGIIPATIKMLEPIQQRLKGITPNEMFGKVSFFDDQQNEMMRSVNKNLLFDMPKTSTLTADFIPKHEQMFKSIANSWGLGIRNVAKGTSFFTKQQLEMFKTIRKGLNISLPNMPEHSISVGMKEPICPSVQLNYTSSFLC